MDAFKPFLGIGLKNYAEYQVEVKPGSPVHSLSSHLLADADFIHKMDVHL